jgi:hypothetical protein
VIDNPTMDAMALVLAKVEEFKEETPDARNLSQRDCVGIAILAATALKYDLHPLVNETIAYVGMMASMISGLEPPKKSTVELLQQLN